jgi:uncharacterized membrane protein
MDTGKVNIHPAERFASAMLGGMLLFRGVRRDSLGGTALAVALLCRGISGHCYMYQLLGIATNKKRREKVLDGAVEVVRSITIDKPANEVYRFWHEPEKLSQVMKDFVEITPISENRTRWQVRAPFKRPREWDTQVVEDRPGEILRWKSLDGGALSEGWVSFRPAPRDWGTETTLHLRFNPLGKWVVRRLGIALPMFAEKALRRSKSLVEAGEIPTLEHNPVARPESSTDYKLLRPLRRA